MEAKAIARYVRMSPMKVNIVLDLIRGKDAAMAVAILKNTPKSAAELLEKLLKSAVAKECKKHVFNALYLKCTNYSQRHSLCSIAALSMLHLLFSPDGKT